MMMQQGQKRILLSTINVYEPIEEDGKYGILLTMNACQLPCFYENSAKRDRDLAQLDQYFLGRRKDDLQPN